MILRLLFALVLFTNYGFSQVGVTNQISSLSKSDYKLQYPTSWILDTSKQFGPELFIFSPLEDSTDRFRENVNVMTQDLKGQNINLEKYKQVTEKQITELATEGEIIESSIKKTAMGELFRITYAMTQGKFRIKITSICLIKDDKAYLVTFSSESSKYDQYKNSREQILNSFRLTN